MPKWSYPTDMMIKPRIIQGHIFEYTYFQGKTKINSQQDHNTNLMNMNAQNFINSLEAEIIPFPKAMTNHGRSVLDVGQ